MYKQCRIKTVRDPRQNYETRPKKKTPPGPLFLLQLILFPYSIFNYGENSQLMRYYKLLQIVYFNWKKLN